MTWRSGPSEVWPASSVGAACDLAEAGASEPDPLAELAFSLGAEVRELREGLGWSRSLLTRYSGTSRAWLVRLEAGTGVPSIAVLTRLASAMGKRVRITFIDEREPLPSRDCVGKEEEGD